MGGRRLVVLVLLGTALVAALAGPAPAAAATYTYVELEPGTPGSTNGTTFEVPVFAFYEPGGGPVNATATEEIAYNLEVEYVGGGATPRVNWSVSDVAAGSFEVGLVLTVPQASGVEDGSGVLALNATLLAPGGGTLAAAGTIGAETLNAAGVPSTWWETWFGATTPPPDTDSIGGIFAFLAWLDATTTGRALYMLTTLVAVSLYLYEAHKLTRAKIAGREDRRG
jgi:hypothetical protein